MVFVKVFIFLTGLFLMFYLSRYLVDSLVHFAHKVRVSDFLVGAIILSLGTSLPEIIDSVVGSVLGLGDLVVGLLVGSNISNVLLIFGLINLLNPLKSLTKREVNELWVGWLLLVFPLFFIFDGVVSRFEGFVLLLLFGFYQWFLHKKKLHSGSEVFLREIEVDYLLTSIAIFSILVAGWVVVNSGVSLAIDFGIPISILGLLVLALGTSTPELSSGLISATKKHVKLAFGDITGSNMVNWLLILGLASLINPLILSNWVVFGSALFFLIVYGVIIVYASFKKGLSKGFALLMVLSYVLYVMLVSNAGGG